MFWLIFLFYKIRILWYYPIISYESCVTLTLSREVRKMEKKKLRESTKVIIMNMIILQYLQSTYSLLHELTLETAFNDTKPPTEQFTGLAKYPIDGQCTIFWDKIILECLVKLTLKTALYVMAAPCRRIDSHVYKTTTPIPEIISCYISFHYQSSSYANIKSINHSRHTWVSPRNLATIYTIATVSWLVCI